MNTGVVYTYCPQNKYWEDLLDYSISSLDIPAYVIECKTHLDCLEARLNLPSLTPFEKTIYLDVDTVVLGSLSEELFAFKSGLSMQSWWNSCDLFRTPAEWIGLTSWRATEAEIPWWNAGMMVLDNKIDMLFSEEQKSISSFFEDWKYQWTRYKDREVRPLEPALINTIFEGKYKINRLDHRWNIPVLDTLRDNSLSMNWFKLIHAAGVPIEDRLLLLKRAKAKYKNDLEIKFE